MTPEEICKIFTETALKPEKCVDFDIKYVSTATNMFPLTPIMDILPQWIEKYDLARKEPRFAEIAMLIMSAAQIYGRKVDYVEEFILNLCKAFKSLEDGPATEGLVPHATPLPPPLAERRTRVKLHNCACANNFRNSHITSLKRSSPTITHSPLAHF